MKVSPIVLVLLLSLIVLGGCASHETKLMASNAKYYDQTDLEMFFSKDRRANFVTAKGAKGTIHYYPDRTMRTEFNRTKDDGQYTLKEGKVCSTWQTLRKGEKCTKLYQVGENEFEYVSTNGAYDSTLTLVE